MDARHWHIGLVGYGEVGRILAEDLRAQDVAVHACDVKLDSASAARPLRDHAEAHGVRLHPSHAALAAAADFVVSAVTASQTVAVAEACAPALGAAPSSSTSTPRRPVPSSAPPRSSTAPAAAMSKARS